MNSGAAYFSPDYFVARRRFRQAIEQSHGRLDVLDIDAPGPTAEKLSIDIGSLGAQDSRHVLLHSSGIHGVEGFAGSAVQLQLLDHLPALPEGTSLILAHTLNPYGMAWMRRVNENNVDLNRNFVGPEPYTGAPEIYARVDSFLNPPTPPSADFYFLKAAALVVRYGLNALKQAVAEGQYEYPKGLFFGGRELQPGPEKLERFLSTCLSNAANIVAIDTHTGLGKYGCDLLLAEPADYEGARHAFGDRIAPLDPKKNPAYQIRGGFRSAVFRSAPHARVAFVTQEFGTYGPLKVLHALREENRWYHCGSGALDHPAKEAVKDAFCPSDEQWRESVVRHGREAVERALSALMKGSLR
jgi:hypothetical protein